MPRPKKRKVLNVVILSDEQQNTLDKDDSQTNNQIKKVELNHFTKMCVVMRQAEHSAAFHKKYIRELQNAYEKMDHDRFMYFFIKIIKLAMQAGEKSEFAKTALHFCSKFASSYQTSETHPILSSTFDWLLSTISYSPNVRYRMCQFVNFMLDALGNEASLEDNICDNILTYMLERLRDINPNVRLQAILALQRLQIPDNPDDIVVKSYQFHLSSDPSSRVREAVITAIGRNYNTIPYIIERLWDVDEKVRRHTYVHMSSYPVKAYKVSQRLTFLEQGLKDRSESIRKVVTRVLLPQWFESYNKNFILFISALKLDANEVEIDRFRKITKVALKEMFKKHSVDELISNLPFEEKDGLTIVPLTELSVEVTLYWLTLVEYLQDKDEIDMIIPELSPFCTYILSYCETVRTDLDKWEKLEHQYVLLTLMEIIYMYDLGDDYGRKSLKYLLETILKNYDIGERIIEVIVKCTENLIENQEERIQFFVDIINDMLDVKASYSDEFTNERIVIDEYFENSNDKTLKLRYSTFKVKMLELKEQEINLIENKQYLQAEKITEELNQVKEEYNSFLKHIIEKTLPNGLFTSSVASTSLTVCGSSTNDVAVAEETRVFNSLQAMIRILKKKITTDIVTKCVKISFYAIASKKVNSLTPNANKLYHQFIRRHMESNSITIRGWALKCGTAYSMLYEQLSKDVFEQLHTQFFKTSASKLWKTSIDCIFELIDRYGFSKFDIEDVINKDRKHNRQLYSRLEFLDIEDETSSSTGHGGNISLMFMLSHFLDTCEDTSITSATVKGFCRLILHDKIKNDGIFEKLLLKYFNPMTDPETNQILGVFYENLIKLKKQEFLQQCLLSTITTILSASYDSPLHEIKPENVIKFIIDSTRPELCSPGLNIHNTIALSFLQEMQNNINNKELLRLLSKELITLHISSDDATLHEDAKICFDKILQCELDPMITKYIQSFKDLLEGNCNQLTKSCSTANNHTVEECSIEDELGKDAIDVDPVIDKTNENIETTDANKSINVENINETESNINEKESNVNEKESNVNEKENQKENSENVENQIVIKSTTTNTKNNGVSTDLSSSIIVTTDVNNDEKSNENKNITSRKSMPTTYGKNNTTDLKYLRKSLNISRRRNSDEEGPSRPPKIRIEAKLESSAKQSENNTKNLIEKSVLNKENLTLEKYHTDTETTRTRTRLKNDNTKKTVELNNDNRKKIIRSHSLENKKRLSKDTTKSSDEQKNKKITTDRNKITVSQSEKKSKTNDIQTTKNSQINLRSRKQLENDLLKTSDNGNAKQTSVNSKKKKQQNDKNNDDNDSLISSSSCEIPSTPKQKKLKTLLRRRNVYLTASVERKMKNSKCPIIKISSKLNLNTNDEKLSKSIKPTDNNKSVQLPVRVSARKKLNLNNDNNTSENLIINNKTNNINNNSMKNNKKKVDTDVNKKINKSFKITPTSIEKKNEHVLENNRVRTEKTTKQQSLIDNKEQQQQNYELLTRSRRELRIDKSISPIRTRSSSRQSKINLEKQKK